MSIDLPPLIDVPPGYERRASGLLAPSRRIERRGGMPGLGALPGLMAGKSILASIAQQASAESTAATITWPSVAAGDLAIMWDYAEGASVPTAVTPSGFTNFINNEDASNWRSMISFKVCAGSESGPLTGMNSSLMKKGLVTFRGNIPLTAAAAAGAQASAVTNANPSSITVLASAGTAPLLVLGFYRSSGAVTPRTFTVGGSGAKDGELGLNTSTRYYAWKLYLASPADVLIDMDDNGNTNQVLGAYIELTA